LRKKLYGVSFDSNRKYQYATVPAGASAVVYVYPIPWGFTGFIDQVANSWYPNTYLLWFAPTLVEKVQRVIGQIDAPKHYDPPIVAESEIRWVAYNNDIVDHVFQILCDGVLYQQIPVVP